MWRHETGGGALSLASAAEGGNSGGIARLERCHHR
jgi:hypothetical protein